MKTLFAIAVLALLGFIGYNVSAIHNRQTQNDPTPAQVAVSNIEKQAAENAVAKFNADEAAKYAVTARRQHRLDACSKALNRWSHGPEGAPQPAVCKEFRALMAGAQ